MLDTIIAEMNMLRKLTKRRAVSPVIATVILVAVAITVAVAVSYWMAGISSQYTSFEKIEVSSGICTVDSYTPCNWIITITLKNTGTATATLDSVYLNDVAATIGQIAPTNGTGTGITSDLLTTGLKLESGVTRTVIIWVGGSHPTLSSGTTVNVKIHSVGGMDYIKLTKLI